MRSIQLFAQIQTSLAESWRSVDLIARLALSGEVDALTKLQAHYKYRYDEAEGRYEVNPQEPEADRIERLRRNLEPLEPEKLIAAARPKYEIAVESSIVVVAHTTLEASIDQALELSARLVPNRWLELITDQKISISEILAIGVDAALQDKVLKSALRCTEQSLPKRIQRLLEVSGATEASLSGQQSNFELLCRIDARRHALVHSPNNLIRNFMPVSQIAYSLLTIGEDCLRIAAMGHGQAWAALPYYMTHNHNDGFPYGYY